MIQYSTCLTILDNLNLDGFFVGWPNPPSKEVFHKILTNSYRVVIAYDENKLVGFINSLSDGILSAYIPLLEVLPEYHKKGIGMELVNMMKVELEHLYMIDLLCDKELIPYYNKVGLQAATGTCLRNYENQSGLNNILLENKGR